MAKPLKPFVRGGGYYPSSRWTPLVYPGGYTTANGNGAEPTPLIKTVKGAIAHVTDALAVPAIGLKCEINPLQAGAGDPSPGNVRPITGCTGCNIYRSGEDMSSLASYPITFPSEAGTVYGGTLDVTNKKLTIIGMCIKSTWGDGTNATILGSYERRRYAARGYDTNIFNKWLCSVTRDFRTTGYSGEYTHITAIAGGSFVGVYLPVGTDNNTPVDVYYPLIDHVQVDLTGIPEITTLLGTNNIWHDANGDTELTYYAE